MTFALPLDRDWSDQFPILHRMTFFNHAGVAPLCRAAADALRAYAQQAASAAYVDSGWYRRARQIKSLAARFLNAASSEEIAFVPNTSSGLSLVARGLRWAPGDEVVITNVEYPANRYPWQDLSRLGVKLIEVAQLPDGRIDVEDVIEAVTDHTRVVSLSHVQYASGHRIDLRPIADTVHRVGGYLCVDAIQSLGAVPLDVRAMGIDFLAADGHKWLLSAEGAGLFYARRDLIELLHPNVVGWMNMADAENYGDYRFEFRRDAGRFEPGSYNIPGILALGASLDLLLSIGVEGIWSRIEALTDYLAAGLGQRGYRVFSPRDRSSEKSGIVSFLPPAGTAPQQIAAALERQSIVVAVREGRLRASPHFYNTPQQVDALLAALPAR